MTAPLTSKGQITIPLAIRQRLNLKAGDEPEFDETSPVLTAHRVVNRDEWEQILSAWQDTAAMELQGHPWEKKSAAGIIDDLRGGPAEQGSKIPEQRTAMTTALDSSVLWAIINKARVGFGLCSRQLQRDH